MQAVILAAGKGTRLHPITLNRSKAMAPVVGKPMVERVIAQFYRNGVRDFIIVISDEDQEIQPYFQSETTLKANFRFVVQTQRLGMANALSQTVSLINQSFIVSACDNIVPDAHIAALLDTFRDWQANAVLSLMALPPEQIARSSAVAWHNGKISRIVEKPSPGEAPSNLASLPLYIFSPILLDYLPQVTPSTRGEYELQDAIQMLIEREGNVRGVLTEDRVQLTNVDDLLFLNRHFLNQTNGQRQKSFQGHNVKIIEPVFLADGVTIGENCVIGPDVSIETGCQIGSDVSLKDTIILRNSMIRDGMKVISEVVNN